MVVRYEKNPNLLKNELDHLQKILRKKFRYETITLSAEETLKNTLLYRREDILPTLSKIIDV